MRIASATSDIPRNINGMSRPSIELMLPKRAGAKLPGLMNGVGVILGMSVIYFACII
jgi:hypothetical protein